MPVTVRSFAKINLGLCIGPVRPDRFHDLRTVYQTIALHDIIQVEVRRGSGIEIRSDDERVPKNETNTCYKVADRVMAFLKASGKVVIDIQKRLPVQGGLGGASGNAVSTLLALERALKKRIPGPDKLRIASEVGSDLPLFLVGGCSLGVSHGEEVYPLPDLPSTYCVIATPEVGVSTPKAFADWDALISQCSAGLRTAWTTEGSRPHTALTKLTASDPSDRMFMFGRMVASWLSGVSGVPAKGRGRAETLLLDLVRTGIENDFEQVVFPQYPALREVKCVLAKAGAIYASLSGSGSALYGLYRDRRSAESAALKVKKLGTPAVVTTTITRSQYWKRIFDC